MGYLTQFVSIVVVCVHVRLRACAAKPLRISCVGDSITYGTGTTEPLLFSYPSELQLLLGAEFEVLNFGVPGATMLKRGDLPYWNQTELLLALNSAPDVVIIMLGTNDAKPQNFDASVPGEFERDALDLVGLFKDLPSQPTVFLNLPIPAYFNPFGIQGIELREVISPILRSVSKQTNVNLIDTFPGMLPFRRFQEADGIHPDNTGAFHLAEVILRGLLSPLGIAEDGLPSGSSKFE